MTITSRKARHSSKSNNYYTPAPIIEAARYTLSIINLDPASCEQANKTVKAERYMDEAENGLRHIWYGNVFLNPPYGWTYTSVIRKGRKKLERISSQELWSKRLLRWFHKGYVKNAILLVNAETGSSWFNPLWEFPICFPRERIKFNLPDGTKADQPTHSNAIICITREGRTVERFNEIYSTLGSVVVRYSDLMEYLGKDIR